MADLVALKAEIQLDPANLAYGAWASLADDARIQALLHDPTKRSRPVVLVASYRVFNCADTAEYAALTQLPLLRFSAVLAGGLVDLAAVTTRDILRDIFPVGGNTRTALVALWNAQVQKFSRAEELGLGATVQELTQARLLP